MRKGHSYAPFILFAVTVSQSIGFIEGQIAFLRRNGYRVGVVSSPGRVGCEGAEVYSVPMKRGISPMRDVVSLWKLFRLFRRLKPTVVNAGTPKAGLLCSMAAWLARVPVRIYTVHGLRFETVKGAKRGLLMLLEKVAAGCSHRVLAVSPSLRSKIVDWRIAPERKTTVVLHGSSNGVDCGAYAPTDALLRRSREIRAEHGIPEDAVVAGFVGRLAKDKGIEELVEAFEQVQRTYPELYLLLCGDDEEEDPIGLPTRERIARNAYIKTAGFVSDVAPYYHSMNMFVFPTYREGMPTVLLEAGAASLPAIATEATGCVDAVVAGVTGTIVPIGDSGRLAQAIEDLLERPDAAKRMGERARERMERDFVPRQIWTEHLRLYENLLDRRGYRIGVKIEA